MATMGREPHSRNRKEHMHSDINRDLKMMKTEVVGHDLSTSKLPPGTGKDTWDHVQRRALELASTSNLVCPLCATKTWHGSHRKQHDFYAYNLLTQLFSFLSRPPLLHASTRDFSSFWVPFTNHDFKGDPVILLDFRPAPRRSCGEWDVDAESLPPAEPLYHWELVQPWRKAHSMFGSIVLSKNVVLPWCLSSPPVWSAGKSVSLRFVNPLVPYWLEPSRCCPKFPSIYMRISINGGTQNRLFVMKTLLKWMI